MSILRTIAFQQYIKNVFSLDCLLWMYGLQANVRGHGFAQNVVRPGLAQYVCVRMRAYAYEYVCVRVRPFVHPCIEASPKLA